MSNDRCNINYTKNEVQWLISQIETLKPFVDVIISLNKLRETGYKMAILSNGDQNMLEEMNKGYDFNFDYILSSETNGYYKPHPSIYELPEKI